MGKRNRVTEEKIMFVIENYSDISNPELVKMVGISKSSIDRICKRYGLKKSKAHLRDMGRKAGKASNIARGGDSSSCHTPDAIAKRVATYKRVKETDEARVKWGLKQLTKIHLQKRPKDLTDQKWYLTKLGYIVDETTLIAYYTPRTHRARRLEAIPRGTTKSYMHSYFDFRPYEGRMD